MSLSGKDKKSPSGVGSAGKGNSSEHETFNIHRELKEVKDFESDSFVNRLYPTRVSNSGLSVPFFEKLFPFEWLSIDKLSIVIPTFKDTENPVCEKFYNFLDSLILSFQPSRGKADPVYKNCYMLSNGIYISYRNRDNKRQSVRFELNPNHIPLSELVRILFIFPEHRFNLIKVTRMDIAIDYYHAGVSPEMFMDTSSRRKRGFIMEGDKFETVNLGSNYSPVHYTIYDKQAEMRKIVDMPYCCRVEGKFTKEDNICFCFSDFKKSQVKYSSEDKKFIYFGGSFMPFGDIEFGGNIDIPVDAKPAQIMYAELMKLNAIAIIRRKLPRRTFQRYKSWFDSLPRSTGIIHSPNEIMELCFSDLMQAFWGRLRVLYNDFVIDDELTKALKKGVPLSKLGNLQNNNN